MSELLNFEVIWIGTRWGYEIRETYSKSDDHSIFKTFREARMGAIAKAQDEVKATRQGLTQTKALRKSDVGRQK